MHVKIADINYYILSMAEKMRYKYSLIDYNYLMAGCYISTFIVCYGSPERKDNLKAVGRLFFIP